MIRASAFVARTAVVGLTLTGALGAAAGLATTASASTAPGFATSAKASTATIRPDEVIFVEEGEYPTEKECEEEGIAILADNPSVVGWACTEVIDGPKGEEKIEWLLEIAVQVDACDVRELTLKTTAGRLARPAC
jgi:hypothetical protein